MSITLTKRQDQVLIAVIEALLPALPPPASSSAVTPLERGYWEHSLASDAAYLDTVRTAIGCKMTSYDQTSFTLLLTALSTSVGTSLIFGVWSTWQSFDQWSLTERTRQLHQLQHSSFVSRRKVFIGLKKFLCAVAYSFTDTSPSSPLAAHNPFWDPMGFPGSPVQWQVDVVDQEQVALAMQRQAPVRTAVEAQNSLVGDSNAPTTLECDVVIVGSGAGGCLASQILSRAGWKVIVLEKSVYKSPDTIALSEAVAMDEQYEQHGLLQTTSGVVSIMAGSAVGGGTAINWGCCLPLPDYVKAEWNNTYGILHDANEYDAALTHVLGLLGATDTSHVTHNAMNLKLQEGCDALKYDWSVTGQSLRDPGDVAAGYIGMGDRYGNKNSGVQSCLVDAVQHGAQIVQHCRVDRVVTTLHASSPCRRRATGVECTIVDPTATTGNHCKLVVHARQSVIVAAGALRTPLVLHASGLRNRHVGRHLRLHPVAGVLGFASSDDPIDSIMGAPMTTVCNEFARGPSGNGYGAKIENPCSYPGLLAAASPWVSVPVYKSRMLRYRNCIPLIVLQRDSGEGGTVRASRNGTEVVVDYTVNEADKQSMIQGLQGAARLLIAAKVPEVSTGHIRDPAFVANGDESDSDTNEYIDSIASRGMVDHEIGIFSAHQMGTCRMTSSPLTGAVDPNGETWECDDLFVMDGSLFPTASGSNPMVTVLTLSYMLSTRLNLLLQLRNSDDNGDKPAGAGMSAEDRSKAMELSKERDLLRSKKCKGSGNSTLKTWSVLLPVALAVLSGWIIHTRDRKA